MGNLYDYKRTILKLYIWIPADLYKVIHNNYDFLSLFYRLQFQKIEFDYLGLQYKVLGLHAEIIESNIQYILGVQQMTHLFFRRKKVTKCIHSNQTTLQSLYFQYLTPPVVIHYTFLLPSEGIFVFLWWFHLLCPQAYLENKVINCVTGISALWRKRAFFYQFFQRSTRIQSHFVDSVYLGQRQRNWPLRWIKHVVL